MYNTTWCFFFLDELYQASKNGFQDWTLFMLKSTGEATVSTFGVDSFF